MNHFPINVYVPNLKKRTDRKESVQAQYMGKDEFKLHIVPAIEHSNGAWGLWQTFYRIVSKEAEKNTPFFIFSEDDHVFTDCYTFDFLFKNIEDADSLDADLLSGGMSWFENPIQMTNSLFWVKAFNGMQFTIIFRRFYSTILSCRTDVGHVTDAFLSGLSENIFVIFPYISTQADFGYSDVTIRNNLKGHVPALFRNTLKRLQRLDKVRQFYHQSSFENIPTLDDVDNITLPTFIINLPSRTDRREHIIREFNYRKEFEVHFIDACIHPLGNIGLWQSICKIVKLAKEEGEDVILICEDDHIFTPDYDKTHFLNQVWVAGMMGTDLLSGGIGGFGDLVPVTNGLYWTDWLWCTQFIVIYKRAFSKILSADFKDTDVADEYLSHLLTNKLVILPFISVQKDFGYSDVTIANNEKGKISRYFDKTKERADAYLRSAQKNGIMQNEYAIYNNKISSILKDMPIKALHLGCGTNLLEGWLNTDINAHGSIMELDASLPFPIKDCSLDFIFSEHMFEHLTYESGKAMLRECYRTLKPGGVLRLTMPTMEFLIKLYNEPGSELHQRYARWSLQQFAPQMYADCIKRGKSLPMAMIVNNFMRFWGHQMIYDFPLLKAILTDVGFLEVKRYEVGQSDHPFLRGLEHHGDVIPKWANDLESTTIEATKPTY